VEYELMIIQVITVATGLVPKHLNKNQEAIPGTYSIDAT
jgi:hypothetical protein